MTPSINRSTDVPVVYTNASTVLVELGTMARWAKGCSGCARGHTERQRISGQQPNPSSAGLVYGTHDILTFPPVRRILRQTCQERLDSTQLAALWLQQQLGVPVRSRNPKCEFVDGQTVGDSSPRSEQSSIIPTVSKRPLSSVVLQCIHQNGRTVEASPGKLSADK